MRIRHCTDRDECRHLWQRHWPSQCLFDEWPVRACFDSSFKRKPCFIVAEAGDKLVGLLALSWIEEERYYGHFPGEVWQGRTWLEQNRILAQTPMVRNELLASVPGPAEIRYLLPLSPPPWGSANEQVDELGYLHFPGDYGYCFDTYLQAFSGRSRKKLHVELDALEAQGVTYRYDDPRDVDWLFRHNLETFGAHSYFSDQRFLNSFKKLLRWLADQKMLRITTLLIRGKRAAVDVGALHHAQYTVLAGGTAAEFPGVAKLINFHHLKWANEQKLEMVDFLCGDFGWKQRFHLEERPLFSLKVTTSGHLASSTP